MAPLRLEIYRAKCFVYSVLKQARCHTSRPKQSQSSQLDSTTQLAINHLKMESRTTACKVPWDINSHLLPSSIAAWVRFFFLLFFFFKFLTGKKGKNIIARRKNPGFVFFSEENILCSPGIDLITSSLEEGSGSFSLLSVLTGTACNSTSCGTITALWLPQTQGPGVQVLTCDPFH